MDTEKPNLPAPTNAKVLLPHEVQAIHHAIATTERSTLKLTHAHITEIYERLAKGETLAKICKDKHLPSYSAVWDWRKRVPLLEEALIRARDAGHDTIASETRLVARGDPLYSSGDVKRDRLIIETDMKLLAAWNHQKYGQRMQVDGISHTNNVLVSSLPTEQLVAQLTTLSVNSQLPQGVKVLEDGKIEIDGDYVPTDG